MIRAAFALAMALVLIQDNGWHFADEDQDVPSWTQDLKEQAPEMALFAAFATLAMVSFFRKSEALKYVTMGVSIVYLGFMRSELITVVNIFALTRWNLKKHSLGNFFTEQKSACVRFFVHTPTVTRRHPN